MRRQVAQARLLPIMAVGVAALLWAAPVSAATFLIARAEPIGTES